MADAAPAARTPADFLKGIKGRAVIVKLNSGVEYRGTFPQTRFCACFCTCAAHACHGGGSAARCVARRLRCCVRGWAARGRSV
jgi:hypothetical protein